MNTNTHFLHAVYDSLNLHKWFPDIGISVTIIHPHSGTANIFRCRCIIQSKYIIYCIVSKGLVTLVTIGYGGLREVMSSWFGLVLFPYKSTFKRTKQNICQRNTAGSPFQL